MPIYLLKPRRVDLPIWDQSARKLPVQIEAEDIARARHIAATAFVQLSFGGSGNPWLRTDLVTVEVLEEKLTSVDFLEVPLWKPGRPGRHKKISPVSLIGRTKTVNSTEAKLVVSYRWRVARSDDPLFPQGLILSAYMTERTARGWMTLTPSVDIEVLPATKNERWDIPGHLYPYDRGEDAA